MDDTNTYAHSTHTKPNGICKFLIYICRTLQISSRRRASGTAVGDSRRAQRPPSSVGLVDSRHASAARAAERTRPTTRRPDMAERTRTRSDHDHGESCFIYYYLVLKILLVYVLFIYFFFLIGCLYFFLPCSLSFFSFVPSFLLLFFSFSIHSFFLLITGEGIRRDK